MVNVNKRKEISGPDDSNRNLRKKPERFSLADASFNVKEERGEEFKKNGAKRKKRKLMVEDKVEIKDRLSELPLEVILYILDFLKCPKDVARTSILSKKWKSIWDSFPTFDFDQRCFPTEYMLKMRERYRIRGSEMLNFKGYVNKSIATRLGNMSSIQKFKLYVSNFNSVLASPINHWIRAAITKNVKDLDIHVDDKRKLYQLPQVVLSCKTIISLKLYGMRLGDFTSMKLYNLRVLSVKDAYIDGGMIKKFVGGCPLIEDLRLVYCIGLDCLHMSSLAKLNRVEVHKCRGLNAVEIDAPNLETFWFHGMKNSQCKISLTGCENLKNLTLKDSDIKDELFQDQISKFPNLEKLVIMECNKLERITILSNIIKRLSLFRCWKLEEASVDAPHLISFEYTGDKMPFSSMNISRLHEAKLYFDPFKRNSRNLLELQSFIGKITQSEGLKLFVCSKQNLTVYEELRKVVLHPSRHYKFELTRSSKALSNLADSWLSKIHPKVLNVVSSRSSEFLKNIQELILGRPKNPECCTYYSNKCWRHYLVDVKISEICDTLQQTTFILKWNPKILRQSF